MRRSSPRVDALGFGARVTFAGRVSAQRLDGYYRAASVFALATRYEGYGIVFDEALVHGLPIVSCATGAVPQTVPGDAGLLVPPEDPEAFAEALREILSNSALRERLSRNAAHYGEALPGWKDTAAIAGGVLDGLP